MSFTPEEEKRIKAIEDGITSALDMMESITVKLNEVDKKTLKKSTGLFGGKRKKTSIKDTKTGVVYASKSAVGKALYGEIKDGDPGDRFIWYKLLTQFPERFVELDEQSAEAQKVWADEKAKIEKEVEEANKKLAAEEAAKKKAGK